MDASPSPNELVLCFFFCFVVPCTYVAYIIIFIEEAWKRATNYNYVIRCVLLHLLLLYILLYIVILNVIQKLYTVLYYSCYTQLCIEYPYAKLYTCG